VAHGAVQITGVVCLDAPVEGHDPGLLTRRIDLQLVRRKELLGPHERGVGLAILAQRGESDPCQVMVERVLRIGLDPLLRRLEPLAEAPLGLGLVLGGLGLHEGDVRHRGVLGITGRNALGILLAGHRRDLRSGGHALHRATRPDGEQQGGRNGNPQSPSQIHELFSVR
jgi:hypothetical protein